jgi:branched-chain amino acid transport system substrate-binding protein
MFNARFPRWRAGAAALATLALFSAPSFAELRIGVVISTTGPYASLGIPAEMAVKLWPTEIAGEKLKVTVLNDNSDTSTTAKNTSKLITEDNIDVLVGAGSTPTTLAALEVAGAAKVPVLSLAGGGAIVLPQDGPRRWAFKLTPTETITANRVFDHFLQHGGKTMATITLANGYGEGFLKAVSALAPTRGVKLVGNERYNPTDQTVTAQVLKIVAAQPDAVFILAASTPGALPHMELVRRGYKGRIYQTQGIANNDFLRIGGKEVEGGFVAVAPVLVAEQLPESNASKKPALEFLRQYEERYGANSRSLFAATPWDVMLILKTAVPAAMKTAKPGTPEFRTALRDAIEGLRHLVLTEGVFNMSPTDHNGADASSQVLVKIEKGGWVLVN